MKIPSSVLKEVLKQAAIEVGKSAGSEIKSGVKEASEEKGKELGKSWTETVIERIKSSKQEDEYVIPIKDAMEILKQEESKLPDESEIDWTKEQLYQLSDQEFIELLLKTEEEEASDEEIEILDTTPLDGKDPHTNYLINMNDSELGEIDFYHKITRHNEDLTEGSPDMLANSLHDYVKMYNIDPEAIAISTQESVDRYFKLESYAKYNILINDENWIRREASKYDINQSDLGEREM